MLTDHLRSWIYNKVQGHYRRELYFQSLDIPFYFSIFKFCLSESNNFQELEINLKKYGMNNCLNFVRKITESNENLKFSYPSLSFQAESLFHCWDEILEIQEQSGEDISKAIKYQRDLKFMEDEDKDEVKEDLLDTERICYGNKPNLAVLLKPNLDEDLQKEEERKVFPIATDFKYEYNSFRRSVIVKSKNIIKVEQNNVIFIQTDIKTFFHNLQINSLAIFIEEKFPKAKNLCKYLRLLKKKFDYDTLPIGWILSRFVANIVTQEFHLLFNKYLSKNFQNSLEKKQFSIPKGDRIDLSKKWSVALKHQINYVDDFIFLLSIPTNSKGISEKIITELLLQEASNLLNKVLKENKVLEFHNVNSDKTKYHLFNKDNISSLKTNFSFFNTADDYLTGDSEITARVDEILLPVDNDITLNANQQFHRNLKGLQKIVIGNRHFREEEVNDLLGQIQIKIEKTGSRYIRSVFRLFYLLELSALSDNIKKQIRTNEINNIFNKFKNNNNYSFEWIKFFNGYFNFLRSINYQDTDQFLKLLNTASQLMKNYTEDDKMLFRLLKNEYIYKIILNIPDKQKLKNKALGELKKIKNNTLLLLSNQRRRSIILLSEAIHFQNKKRKNPLKLKPVDLTWISIILNQILIRNHNIEVTKILSIIENFQKKNSETLNFGLSRVAAAYLPFNNEHNQLQFIKTIEQYKDDPFWKITCELIYYRKHLIDYYKYNEKNRLEQILQTIKKSNFLRNHIEVKTDIIWYFIKKSFSFEQNQICAYFIANRLNNESEFIKYILTANLKIESSQLTSWSAIPLTLQKTGIYTNLIIKKLFEMQYNEQNKCSDIIGDIQIVNFMETALNKINIQKLDKFINKKSFGVNIVNLDLLSTEFEDQKLKGKPFKITIAPLHLNLNKDLNFSNGFRFKNKSEKLIDLNIRGAIDEAVRQEASVLVFPELSIPRNYLRSYLKLASEHHIVLIGGLEYFTGIKKTAYNSTIVSIPVKRSLNPGGREYFTFEQMKNFPSSEETYHLSKHTFEYQKGTGIFIFKSDFWGDFAVLTCSDFLSLGLRWILQGEVQTVFVPAQNKDSVTYDHISETSIRDLHCLTIVCNNPERGSSHCYAPYYNHSKRQVFKKIGISKPEYHTFKIDHPKKFRKTQQEANPERPFRDLESKKNNIDYPFSEYKQLPPDWRFWE